MGPSSSPGMNLDWTLDPLSKPASLGLLKHLHSWPLPTFMFFISAYGLGLTNQILINQETSKTFIFKLNFLKISFYSSGHYLSMHLTVKLLDPSSFFTFSGLKEPLEKWSGENGGIFTTISLPKPAELGQSTDSQFLTMILPFGPRNLWL